MRERGPSMLVGKGGSITLFCKWASSIFRQKPIQLNSKYKVVSAGIPGRDTNPSHLTSFCHVRIPSQPSHPVPVPGQVPGFTEMSCTSPCYSETLISAWHRNADKSKQTRMQGLRCGCHAFKRSIPWPPDEFASRNSGDPVVDYIVPHETPPLPASFFPRGPGHDFNN